MTDGYPEVSSYRVGKAMVESSLAKVLQKRRALPEARALLEDSVSILEALDREPRKPRQVRVLLGMNLRVLSGVLAELGEKDQAAEADRRADELGLRSGRMPGPVPRQGESSSDRRRRPERESPAVDSPVK